MSGSLGQGEAWGSLTSLRPLLTCTPPTPPHRRTGWHTGDAPGMPQKAPPRQSFRKHLLSPSLPALECGCSHVATDTQPSARTTCHQLRLHGEGRTGWRAGRQAGPAR